MNLLGALLDLLYPPKCILCRKLLRDGETDICAKCRTALPEAEQPIKREKFFRQCHSVWFYEGAVAESVRRYKFHGAEHYCRAYGRLLAMRILRAHVDFDVLTWVPVSRRRKRERGYDQSYLLARETARQLRVPCVRTLTKVLDNLPQSRRPDAAARRANVRNAYRAYHSDRFTDKRILLLDDVITTGATLSEASATLLTAGAASVECATLTAVRIDKSL